MTVFSLIAEWYGQDKGQGGGGTVTSPLERRVGGSHFQPTLPRALDAQSLIWRRPGMEVTASSRKLRAKAPEARKAISDRILNLHTKVRGLHPLAIQRLEQMANPVVCTLPANSSRSFLCHSLRIFSVALGMDLCRNVGVGVRLRVQSWCRLRVFDLLISPKSSHPNVARSKFFGLCLVVRLPARQPSTGWRTQN